VPYVVRLHSAAWTWRRMLNEPAGGADGVERRLEAYTLRRARGITSPSAKLADYIRQACKVDRPVKMIPYPVDTTQFTPGTGPAEPPIVLFVGRVEKRKGADVLMEAIPQIWQKVPNCEFVFAGRVCDDVSEQVRQMPVRVQFLGVVPREELVRWYQRASIFVAPAQWDNSPNTVYEAMACGTPVVASRVGGIPELVDDGVSGLLVSPNDPAALADGLTCLLQDRARREQMGRRGREKALAEYELKNILVSTLGFYDLVLAARDMPGESR
jgi:glycosyltransferase involved in cell wall biosynthesis